MSKELLRRDSFRTWFEKINDNFKSIDEINAFEVQSSSGLKVTLGKGRIRDNSNVISLPEQVVTLKRATINVVGVMLYEYEDPAIEVFDEEDVPISNFIRLYEFQTSNSRVVDAKDLRTILDTSANRNVDSADSMVMFKKVVERDMLVPEDRNALSVGTVTIAEGVTVTVSDTSEWVVV